MTVEQEAVTTAPIDTPPAAPAEVLTADTLKGVEEGTLKVSELSDKVRDELYEAIKLDDPYSAVTPATPPTPETPPAEEKKYAEGTYKDGVFQYGGLSGEQAKYKFDKDRENTAKQVEANLTKAQERALRAQRKLDDYNKRLQEISGKKIDTPQDPYDSDKLTSLYSEVAKLKNEMEMLRKQEQESLKEQQDSLTKEKEDLSLEKRFVEIRDIQGRYNLTTSRDIKDINTDYADFQSKLTADDWAKFINDQNHRNMMIQSGKTPFASVEEFETTNLLLQAAHRATTQNYPSLRAAYLELAEEVGLPNNSQPKQTTAAARVVDRLTQRENTPVLLGNQGASHSTGLASEAEQMAYLQRAGRGELDIKDPAVKKTLNQLYEQMGMSSLRI